MGNIMQIVKSHEESGLLIKNVIQTIDNEIKKKNVEEGFHKKVGFFYMLLDTVDAAYQEICYQVKQWKQLDNGDK